MKYLYPNLLYIQKYYIPTYCIYRNIISQPIVYMEILYPNLLYIQKYYIPTYCIYLLYIRKYLYPNLLYIQRYYILTYCIYRNIISQPIAQTEILTNLANI